MKKAADSEAETFFEWRFCKVSGQLIEDNGDQDIIGGNDNYQSTAAANNIRWHVQTVIGVNG